MRAELGWLGSVMFGTPTRRTLNPGQSARFIKTRYAVCAQLRSQNWHAITQEFYVLNKREDIYIATGGQNQVFSNHCYSQNNFVLLSRVVI
jgi:hypothetical protein